MIFQVTQHKAVYIGTSVCRQKTCCINYVRQYILFDDRYVHHKSKRYLASYLLMRAKYRIHTRLCQCVLNIVNEKSKWK